VIYWYQWVEIYIVFWQVVGLKVLITEKRRYWFKNIPGAKTLNHEIVQKGLGFIKQSISIGRDGGTKDTGF
jgi:hypothetical protein